jgi:hypothetical protein
MIPAARAREELLFTEKDDNKGTGRVYVNVL